MTTYRKNYTPPPYLIEELELTLALDPAATLVTSRMVVTKNPAATMRVPLQLDRGKGLELVSVKIGNATLEEGDYVLDEDKLSLGDVGDRAIVEIVTRVAPNRNTELEGLYVSNGIFCTQCEAEGFRRITFYPDRPDVMAKMRVRVEGDKAKEPILLAGGNPVEAGDLSDGRHYVIYDDPYPKSAYLFAAVGGDLDFIEDSFTTMSGRTVALKIFVNKGNAGKAGHAMASLKAAMAWDEKVYGREYQLDVFNIVAVHDFNMGAMENTGLNIFNAKYVLADAETATDMDFMNVEGVIAHEYFHNWSGNRVTVRDWFQLSLKEGFTVYRDQEFSADMNDRTVKRIEEVERLMRAQFPEDAGPTAHPIRPDTYEEIQNFYTPTVYEKGAEVVRMMATLQGKDNFRKGTDLYFERHDGQAVTCEDFVKAQEDASGIDLSQFRRWYEQAGTPALTAKTDYNITLRRYTVTLRQETPPTPGQPEKLPVVIPVRLGLLARDGAEILATVATMTEAEQSFAFDDIDEEPVLSLLRDFSAPVKLTYEQDADTLRFLMRYDRDGYNRATAARRLAADALAKLLAANNRHAVLDTSYVHALRDLLAVSDHDPALSAEMLSLPAKTVFAQRYETIDVDGIASAYTHAREQIAKALPTFWRDAYELNRGAIPFANTGRERGKRALKNLCLSYLTVGKTPEAIALAKTQYEQADNMTDRLAALACLVRDAGEAAKPALEDFYTRYRHDQLVLDKWFGLQAAAEAPHRLEVVRALTRHPDFTLANPNRVYALIGGFAQTVSPAFHDASGAGYAFLGEIVAALDPTNPQVSSRMVGPLLQWRRYDSARQALMRAELEKLAGLTGLSKNLGEQVRKSLEINNYPSFQFRVINN